MNLKEIIKITNREDVKLDDLLECYRLSIQHSCVRTRDYAINSWLLKCSVADVAEYNSAISKLNATTSDTDHFLLILAQLARLSGEASENRQEVRAKLVHKLIEQDPRLHCLSSPYCTHLGASAKSIVVKWKKLIERFDSDVRIISNAAEFLVTCEDYNLAIDLFKRCAALEPNRSEFWDSRAEKSLEFSQSLPRSKL